MKSYAFVALPKRQKLKISEVTKNEEGSTPVVLYGTDTYLSDIDTNLPLLCFSMTASLFLKRYSVVLIRRGDLDIIRPHSNWLAK